MYRVVIYSIMGSWIRDESLRAHAFKVLPRPHLACQIHQQCGWRAPRVEVRSYWGLADPSGPESHRSYSGTVEQEIDPQRDREFTTDSIHLAKPGSEKSRIDGMG